MGLAIFSGFGSPPDPAAEGFKVIDGDPTVEAILAHRLTPPECENLRDVCGLAMMRNGPDAEVTVAFKASLPDASLLARYLVFPSHDGVVRIVRRGEVGNIVLLASRLFARLSTLKAIIATCVEAYDDVVKGSDYQTVAARVAASRKPKGGADAGS